MVVSIVEIVVENLLMIEAECWGDFPGGDYFDVFCVVLGGWVADGCGDVDDTYCMLSGVSIGC